MYDAARRRIEALRNVDQYLKQNEGSMCCLLRLQTMFSKHPCFHRTQCLSQLLFLLHYEMIWECCVLLFARMIVLVIFLNFEFVFFLNK